MIDGTNYQLDKSSFSSLHVTAQLPSTVRFQIQGYQILLYTQLNFIICKDIVWFYLPIRL